MKGKFKSLAEMVGKKAMPADDYNFSLTENAKAVEAQALENPGIGIPVHPAVAEHMGAFEDKALTPDEMPDDEETNMEDE